MTKIVRVLEGLLQAGIASIVCNIMLHVHFLVLVLSLQSRLSNWAGPPAQSAQSKERGNLPVCSVLNCIALICTTDILIIPTVHSVCGFLARVE